MDLLRSELSVKLSPRPDPTFTGWALSQLWLFIIAPVIGSLIAASVYVAIRPSSPVISVQEAQRALDSEVAERRR